MPHAVKPVDNLALGIKDRQIDVTLHLLSRPTLGARPRLGSRPPLGFKLLPPDIPHGRRYLSVVAVTMPGGDDEGLKLLDDLLVD